MYDATSGGKFLLKHLCFAIFLGIFNLCLAEPGVVRVVDEHGLVRALKSVSTSASILIELGSNFSEIPDISIINVDGLQPEQHGRYDSGRGISFSGIGAGTWRITGSQTPISKVTITPEG